MISFDTRCAVNPNVMFLNVDNEAVLLNTETELYFGLDDIGTLFWTELASAPTIQAALDNLLPKFDGVDEATLRNDLLAFASNLETRGLLVVEA